MGDFGSRSTKFLLDGGVAIARDGALRPRADDAAAAPTTAAAAATAAEEAKDSSSVASDDASPSPKKPKMVVNGYERAGDPKFAAARHRMIACGYKCDGATVIEQCAGRHIETERPNERTNDRENEWQGDDCEARR